MTNRKVVFPMLAGLVVFPLLFAGTVSGLEKETSLVTKEKIGELAVAGVLYVDLHAEFMASRTFEKDTVLNWYDCGRSGGKAYSQGGNFGNFGHSLPPTCKKNCGRIVAHGAIWSFLLKQDLTPQ